VRGRYLEPDLLQDPCELCMQVDSRTKHSHMILDVPRCCMPSDQPRDAARREECSDPDEKSLTTFCRCDGRAKGIC